MSTSYSSARETVKRLRGEGTCSFMERAADAARRVGGSVETEMGVICPTCAPASTTEARVAIILPWQECYNCTYGVDTTPVARN